MRALDQKLMSAKMEEKNNCASRVKWVLVNALHQDNKKTIKEVWSEVLFDSEEYIPDDFEIIRLVETLSNETKLISVKAKKIGLPENLYSPYINKALKSLNITNLNAEWGNYKNSISTDVLVCLAFCAFLIEENEIEIDIDEINKIHASLKELREEMANNINDPMLSSFIENQISIISKALAEYHIRGSSALNNGFSSGLVEIIENEDTIRENINSRSIEKIKNTWGLFQVVTKKAAEVNKSADTWQKILGKGTELIDYISNI